MLITFSPTNKNLYKALLKYSSDPIKYLQEMQKEVYRVLGLGCSIGLSYNKFLAKMGSDYKKPLGITIIKRKDVEKIIYPLPIGDTYGCGKASSARLKELGINTIGDFVKSNDYKVREILGSYYETMLSNCKGEYYTISSIYFDDYNKTSYNQVKNGISKNKIKKKKRNRRE